VSITNEKLFEFLIPLLLYVLEHAAFALNCGVRLGFVSSEKNYPDNGQGANGIIIPGGFGDRGIEGKISAITSALKNFVLCSDLIFYLGARKSNTPVLGLCLGMQLLAVEEARFNGYITANSQEFDDKTSHPVVVKFADQKMRLGGMPVELKQNFVCVRT
jgi:CTP synthase